MAKLAASNVPTSNTGGADALVDRLGSAGRYISCLLLWYMCKMVGSLSCQNLKLHSGGDHGVLYNTPAVSPRPRSSASQSCVIGDVVTELRGFRTDRGSVLRSVPRRAMGSGAGTSKWSFVIRYIY
jgi:hypothetical protein